MSVSRIPVPVALAKLFGESAPVQDSLPIVFGPRARVETLRGLCAGCGQPIDPELFRGQVRRLLPDVALVEAAGLCPECCLLTPYHIRVYKDLSMVLLLGKRWVRYLPSRPAAPLWVRVFFMPLRLLRWILNR